MILSKKKKYKTKVKEICSMSRICLPLDIHYFMGSSQHNFEGRNMCSLLCISENRRSQILSNMLCLHRDYMGDSEFILPRVCCNYHVKQHHSHTLSLLKVIKHFFTHKGQGIVLENIFVESQLLHELLC